MPGAPSATVACTLRSLFQAGTVAGLADAALLSRFLSGDPDRAGPAFAALVDRHAALVLRVCRAALANPHDAEDATQATFLVLARRAASIRRFDSLACWLYGVARRIADKARVDRPSHTRLHHRPPRRLQATLDAETPAVYRFRLKAKGYEPFLSREIRTGEVAMVVDANLVPMGAEPAALTGLVLDPGEHAVYLGEGPGGRSGGTPIDLAPGGTTLVDVGGTGRPVVATVAVPEGFDPAADYAKFTECRVQSDRPEVADPPPGTPNDRACRLRWWSTPEARAYRRDHVDRSAIKLGPGGTIRVDDLPTGKYRLKVEYSATPTRTRDADPAKIARLDLPFTVPPIGATSRWTSAPCGRSPGNGRRPPSRRRDRAESVSMSGSWPEVRAVSGPGKIVEQPSDYRRFGARAGDGPPARI